MGKGKQQRAANNKKKGKNHNNNNGRRNSSSDASNHNGANGAAGDENNDDECVFSLYRRYKEATERVKATLQSLAPSKFTGDLVQNFVDAADFIVQKGKPLIQKTQLLSDLKVAISYRKKYTVQFYEGGDEGHSYFVSVLNYCYHTLKAYCPSKEVKDEDHNDTSTAKKRDSKTKKTEDETEENSFTAKLFRNSFSALSVEDKEDEKEEIDDLEDDDDEAAAKVVARPKNPEKPYSLEACLRSVPEAIHAMRFFELLDIQTMKLQGIFQTLKESIRLLRQGSALGLTSDNDVIKVLASMGVSANQFLEHVQRLESTIALECPTLNTTYRILACVYLSAPMRLISDEVKQESPIGKRFTDDVALGLMADLVESVFHGQLQDHGFGILQDFCKRWKLSPATTEKVGGFGIQIWLSILRDTATDTEKAIYRSFDKLFPEREWLGEYRYLSGDRSLLNTLKMLDLFRFWVQGGRQILNVAYAGAGEKKCQFPPLWHETKNPATGGRIRGDMDTSIPLPIFMFIPEIWDKARPGVHNEKQLLPLFHTFRRWFPFCVKPKSLTFSLAFAVHMIMLSIVEVQGNDDVAFITTQTKTYVRKFIDQISYLMTKEHNEPPESRKSYIHLIASLKALLNLDPRPGQMKSLPLPDEYNRRCEQIGLWSPVACGMIIQYIMLGPSLAEGVVAMDSYHQTRAALHLFNAMKQRGLVSKDLPIISTLDQYFVSCKAIWNGWEKPQKGKFSYRFSLCLGFDHERSLEYQQGAKFMYAGGAPPTKSHKKTSLNYMLSRDRVDVFINLREVSKSYTTILLRDYSGASEGDAIAAAVDPTKRVPLELQEMDARMFLALLYMGAEDNLLQLNLFAVGDLLARLLDELFLESEEAESIRTGKVPWAFERLLVVERIIGKFDYSDDDQVKEMAKKFEAFFRTADSKSIRLDSR